MKTKRGGEVGEGLRKVNETPAFSNSTPFRFYLFRDFLEWGGKISTPFFRPPNKSSRAVPGNRNGKILARRFNAPCFRRFSFFPEKKEAFSKIERDRWVWYMLKI